MKKLLLVLAVLCVVAFGTLRVSADYQYDNLNYEISGNEVIITGCNRAATSVAVPAMINGKYVTEIASGAFADCVALAQISIPGSVTSVGKDAFSNTRYYNTQGNWVNGVLYIDHVLIRVRNTLSGACQVRQGTRVIADYAFFDCKLMESVELPEGITEIPKYAFYWCRGLESINIPESVEKVHADAFADCDALNDVYIKDIESWCDIEFLTINSNPVKNADNLYIDGVLASDISVVIPAGTKKIKDYTFLNWKCIADIQIPESVTHIGTEAFRNCKGFERVILHKTLQNISSGAFYNCSGLNTVLYTGSKTEWNEMSIGIQNDYLLNANIIFDVKEKTYIFETGTNEEFPCVTGYFLPSAPIPYNEGNTFLGWYDNIEHKGDALTFPYYGDATVLYAAWREGTGRNFDEAFEAVSNKTYEVTTTDETETVYYKFVPRVTGEYKFCSDSNYDTYVYLYDDGKWLIELDDHIDGADFCISYNLTAGNTYYIAMGIHGETGTLKFIVETNFFGRTETELVIMSGGTRLFVTTPYYLPEGCEIIFACYKSGKLVEMDSRNNENKDVYFAPQKQYDSVKIMAVDGFNNMMPLCESEDVRIK